MSKKHTYISTIIIFSVIILIFVSILSWTVMLHRDAALFARTRVQFLSYEAALRAYCLEYGEMPHFLGSEEPIWLHVEGNSEMLIKALTGKNPDGTPLSKEDRKFLNPLCKCFYTFHDNDFFKQKDGKIDRTTLADAFNSTRICIIVEDVLDVDVTVPKTSFPSTVQKYIHGDALNKQVVVFSLSKNGKKVIGNWDPQ